MTNDNQARSGPEFDGEVYETLRAAGWLFPETPSEVEEVEQEFADHPTELPEPLADAARVFEMIHLPPADRAPNRALHLPSSTDARSNLARAAREGGEISKDLAERMRQDRRKAGGQANGQ
jgi:hypothetical protein